MKFLSSILTFIIFSHVSLAQEADDSQLQDITKLLRTDASYKKYQWIVKKNEDYFPFVLWFAALDKDKESQNLAQKMELEYRPVLSALTQVWRDRWQAAYQLEPHSKDKILPLLFLPDLQAFQAILLEKFPQKNPLLPAFFDEHGFAVTYHKADGFESRRARNLAVARAAAVGLVELYTAPEGQRSAWLSLGLQSYIADLNQKQGPRGSYYVWEEPAAWRQELAGLADAILNQGVELPEFSELLSFASTEQVVTAIQQKSQQAGIQEQDLSVDYMNYVRRCGYSLILFLQSHPKSEYVERFYKFLEADFKGEGGLQKFKTAFGNLKDLENSWLEYCNFQPRAKGVVPKQKQSSLDEFLRPIPLEFPLENEQDLQIEMMLKLRAGGYAAAKQFLSDEKVMTMDSLKQSVEAQTAKLERARQVYVMFATQVQIGDRLPSGIGLSGNFTDIQTQDFAIKDGREIQRHAWTALDWRGVCNYLFSRLKYDNPQIGEPVILGFLLIGDIERVEKILRNYKQKNVTSEALTNLTTLIEKYKKITLEANAREQIELVGKMEPEKVPRAVAQIAASPTQKNTSTYLNSIPYLRSQITRALAKEYDQLQVQDYFQASSRSAEDNKLSLHYSFLSPRELEDWEIREFSALDSAVKKTKIDPIGDAVIQDGKLIVKPYGGLAHKSQWVGDISMEFRVEAVQSPEGGRSATPYLLVGLCSDALGNYVGNWGFSQACRFYVQGKQTRYSQLLDMGWYAAIEYDFKVAKIADRVEVHFNGRKIAELPEVDVREGGIFLYAAGPYWFQIRELKIIGTLDPQWLKERKTLWVLNRVKEILG